MSGTVVEERKLSLKQTVRCSVDDSKPSDPKQNIHNAEMFVEDHPLTPQVRLSTD